MEFNIVESTSLTLLLSLLSIQQKFTKTMVKIDSRIEPRISGADSINDRE